MNDEDHASGTLDVVPAPASVPFMLAGCPAAGGGVDRHFDGKIDGPMLLAGLHDRADHMTLLGDRVPLQLAAALIARWDFALAIGSVRAVDVGPSSHDGTLEHLPARGMKGWNWTGDEHDFKRKPEHYGAIHFHHDDVYDAAWDTSVAFTVPTIFRAALMRCT